MAKQDTFDTVVAHARKQGCKAETNADARNVRECRYRMPCGKKCFVGILIPEDMYDPEFEGDSPEGGLLSTLLEELGHNVQLCLDLQQVHDNCDVAKWERELENVAEKHKLVYTPPEVTT